MPWHAHTDGCCLVLAEAAAVGAVASSQSWLDQIQAKWDLGLAKTPAASGGAGTQCVAPSMPSDVLEHFQQRFRELTASTRAVAESAVTSETEARARVLGSESPCRSFVSCPNINILYIVVSHSAD